MRPAEAVEHHAALVLRPGVEHAAPRVAGQQHLHVSRQSRIMTGVAARISATARRAGSKSVPQGQDTRVRCDYMLRACVCDGSRSAGNTNCIRPSASTLCIAANSLPATRLQFFPLCQTA